MTWNRPLVARLVPAACAIALLATAAGAHWVQPTGMPVERLVKNLSAHLEENPNDDEAHYLLGRVYGYSFLFSSGEVGVFQHRNSRAGDLPNVAPEFLQDWLRPKEDEETPHPSAEELLQRLRLAIEHHRRAIDLDPTHARYHLGLAYLLDRGSHLASYVDWLPGMQDGEGEDGAVAGDAPDDVMANVRKALQGLIWQGGEDRQKALDSLRTVLRERRPNAVTLILGYRADANVRRQQSVAGLLEEEWKRAALEPAYAAFERAINEDLQIKREPLRGLMALASYEAGKMYLRLVDELGIADDADAAKRVERIKEGISRLEAKPENNAITPIVFSVDDHRSLDQLLAPETHVDFDLDGDGEVETWPWVRPDTAILVWDPDRTGEISSGRQLFGSVTWWLLFSDGYRAMDVLDDDRNGWLEGRELRGLALWFDRNSNGASDPGEVEPIENTPVEALATRPTTQSRSAPANPAGLRLTDGRTLPTYDWVTSPVGDTEAGRGETRR